MALRIRTLSTVLALALALAAPARAQDPSAPAPPTSTAHAPLTGAAKEAVDTGKLLFRDGDFAGALVKFRMAHEESKDPRLLWNMAACEKNMRRYANVLRLVEEYLREGGSQLSDDDRRAATELLTALRPLVSRVRIRVNRPGATIFVEDQEVGTSPLVEPVLVDLGARRIRVTKPGFKEARLTANVSGGANGGEELEVQLEKDKSAEQGRIVVTAGANETIEIDGRRVGIERWSGTVPAGLHSVRVSGTDKVAASQDVTIKDEETRTVDVTLEKQPKSRTWVWVTGGAVLVAGAVVGGYFLLKPSGSDTTTRAPPPSGNFSPGLVQLP